MSGDLDIARQALQLGGPYGGHRVWMLCIITEGWLTSGSLQTPGGRRQRAGSG